MPTKKGKITKLEIEKGLKDQLAANKIYGAQYVDLVNDYLSLWDIKNKLIADIKKRGVSIEWHNGAGQSGYKKNDSIAELNKTNAQMLKILSELGLKAVETKADDEYEL